MCNFHHFEKYRYCQDKNKQNLQHQENLHVKCTAIQYIRLARMGHPREHHLLGRLRCHIFPSVLDDFWVFLQVQIKIDQPTRGKLWYLNRETQKLVPSRNFGHLEPQKFVPANPQKSPIRKIKLPQNFHATRYIKVTGGNRRKF